MPRTLTGVKKAAYVGKAEVAVTGDDREDSNISGPVQALLDDAAYLLAELRTVAENLGNHGHELASADGPGFMTQAEKIALAGFADALASHSHLNATLQKDGFFSKDEKKKLSEIETGAQKVTRDRTLDALGAVLVRRTLPESTFAAKEVKVYGISVPGVTPDDCILSSQYMSNSAQFGIFYHALADEVQVFVRNFSDTNSRTFTPGEITFMVLKF